MIDYAIYLPPYTACKKNSGKQYCTPLLLSCKNKAAEKEHQQPDYKTLLSLTIPIHSLMYLQVHIAYT